MFNDRCFNFKLFNYIHHYLNFCDEYFFIENHVVGVINLYIYIYITLPNKLLACILGTIEQSRVNAHDNGSHSGNSFGLVKSCCTQLKCI
jgi:hypothetical protein